MGASRAAGGYAGKWLWSEKRSYDAHCCCRLEFGEFSSRLHLSPSLRPYFFHLNLQLLDSSSGRKQQHCCSRCKGCPGHVGGLRVVWLPFRCSMMFDSCCVPFSGRSGMLARFDGRWSCLYYLRLQNSGWKKGVDPPTSCCFFWWARIVQFHSLSLSPSLTTLA